MCNQLVESQVVPTMHGQVSPPPLYKRTRKRQPNAAVSLMTYTVPLYPLNTLTYLIVADWLLLKTHVTITDRGGLVIQCNCYGIGP